MRNLSGGYEGYSVPKAEENIRINCRADIEVRGGRVVVRRIERSAGVMNNSMTGMTSSWTLCGVRASNGRWKSDDDAMPEMSSGATSLYSVRGVVDQPEKTKQPEGFGPT